MTSKKVTIQDTEHITEELTICDDCGRELDPKGIRFDGYRQDDEVRYENARKKLDLCSKCYQQYSVNNTTEKRIKDKEKFKNWWTYTKGKYTPRPYITIASVKKRTKELNSEITLYFIVSITLYIPILAYSLYSVDMLSNIGVSLLALVSILTYFQYRIFTKLDKLRRTQKKVTEKLSDSE